MSKAGKVRMRNEYEDKRKTNTYDIWHVVLSILLQRGIYRACIMVEQIMIIYALGR